MVPDLHVVCACGARATHRFDVFDDAGAAMLSRDVCIVCGERLQAEVERRFDEHSDLLRRGVDERMAKRVIDQRIDGGELLGEVARLLDGGALG